MKTELFESKTTPKPLQYGDMVEITFKDDLLHKSGTGFYILTFSDNLVNLDGGVRYKDKCKSIADVCRELRHDINVESWRVLSKDDYTVQIHKNAGAK